MRTSAPKSGLFPKSPLDIVTGLIQDQTRLHLSLTPEKMADFRRLPGLVQDQTGLLGRTGLFPLL